MLNFFHNSYIFILIEKLINFINSVFFVLLLIALSFALIFSPPDYLQGESVRIMYLHVPAAWISLASFTCIAVLSILNFIFKIKNFKLIAKSIAPIGLMFTCIAIVTGSIWGQPTWGTFWAWDARLTSMLILLFFYILFIFSYKYIQDLNTSSKICSIISVLGLINLIIIKYSVDIWSTLHQPSSVNVFGKTSIHNSMLLPLSLMLLVFLVYCALIFLMKYRSEIIRMKRKGLKRL